MTKNNVILRIGAAASSLLVVIGGVLPFGRSGKADRSSYALVRVARTIELLPNPWASLTLLWLSAPMLAAVAVACMVMGYQRTGAILGLLVAGSGIVMGVVVWRSPLLAQVGVWVTIVAGVTAFALNVLLLVKAGRSSTA